MCVCESVCERERGRGRERERVCVRERVRKREREKQAHTGVRTRKLQRSITQSDSLARDVICECKPAEFAPFTLE